MNKRTIQGVLIATLVASSPAFAGEVNGIGDELPLNGTSICKYSGLNDTPEGLWLPIGPGGSLVQVDPGGKVQSYGYFMAQMDFLLNPSEPGGKDSFPGSSCNSRGGRNAG